MLQFSTYANLINEYQKDEIEQAHAHNVANYNCIVSRSPVIIYNPNKRRLVDNRNQTSYIN